MDVNADGTLDGYHPSALTRRASTPQQRRNNSPEISQPPWKPRFDGRPERESPGKDGKTRLKTVTRSTEDRRKIQDERADTIGELWHKLWGKWGLPDEKLNTWTGTATDTHRQDRGSLPAFRMNSVTLLSCYSPPSPPPLLSFNAQRTAGLSLQRSKPIFHPLSPPSPPNYPPSFSILGMAVEILAQTFRRLPGSQTEQEGSFKQRANSPDTHTYQMLTSLTWFTWVWERHVLTKNSSTAGWCAQKKSRYTTMIIIMTETLARRI